MGVLDFWTLNRITQTVVVQLAYNFSYRLGVSTNSIVKDSRMTRSLPVNYVATTYLYSVSNRICAAISTVAVKRWCHFTLLQVI